MINVLPVLGNEIRGIPAGIITLSTMFQGYFIMMMVIPAMCKPERAMRSSIWAMLITGVLYILIVTATVSVFGAEETKKLLWPTLELAKATSLPANVLERLDAVFLAVWVTAVFTSLFSCYYFTIYSISKLFRLADHGMMSFFILPILFVLAMLPQSLVQLNEVNSLISKFGLLITIVYPGVLLIIAMLRKKRCVQMIGNLYSGYLDVAILIWVLSGMFNLLIDKNKYEQSNMTKEMKVSRILGWIHIVIGTALFLSVILVKALV